MLNPYILLKPDLLNAMLKKPMYFVRQYYKRGLSTNDNTKASFLFSHYSQVGIDKERAFRHFELLKQDKHRFLYDSTNKTDLENLQKAAMQPAGYKIFTNVMMKTWTPPKIIRNKVWTYLNEKGFVDPYFENDTLKINLQDLFGNLYLRISWSGTKLEVILDEIENT